MSVKPYLYFNGRCEEALEFYRQKLGAEVVFQMRFGESPMQEPGMIPPGSENKVMHATFRIGASELMASDGHCGGAPKFEGISLAIEGKDAADAERIFAALSDGGQVQMPMVETFFAPRFGMVADKFGVSWMVTAPKPM